MERLHEPDHVTYRMIVLAPGGTESLIVRTDHGLALPTVQIPRFERIAKNLTAVLKNKWGQEAVCLFSPSVGVVHEPPTGANYQAMESLHKNPASEPRSLWTDIGSLSERDFSDPEDYRKLQQSLVDCGRSAHGPFAKLGWFAELQGWVEEIISLQGLHLTGNFSQLNASPTFSLVRFESTGPAVWFKAVGVPNLHEFPVTVALKRILPGYTPRILAVRPEWNGWLTVEAEGSDLSQNSDPEQWRAAAESLAKLQTESLCDTEALFRAGARGISTSRLLAFVDPFFATMTTLMAKQVRTPPPILRGSELTMLSDRIKQSLSALEDIHLPQALGHLDPNPGNIFVSERHVTFLDWAEAYIGNPFLSFQYMLEHFRREVSSDPDVTCKLTNAYLQRWQPIISSKNVRDVLEHTPLVAVFVYAAADGFWQDPNQLRNLRFAAYLRSLTRRMYREAKLMQRTYVTPPRNSLELMTPSSGD